MPEYWLFYASLALVLTLIYVLLRQRWDRRGPPGWLSRQSSQEHLLQVQRRAVGASDRGRLGQKERWTGELTQVLVGRWRSRSCSSLVSCSATYQVFATLKGLLARQPFAVGGSGSAYVYGFVDAEYRRGMSKQEAQQLVVNSEFIFTK